MFSNNPSQVLHGPLAINVAPDKGAHAVQFQCAYGQRDILGEQTREPLFEADWIADSDQSLMCGLDADVGAGYRDGAHGLIFC